MSSPPPSAAGTGGGTNASAAPSPAAGSGSGSGSAAAAGAARAVHGAAQRADALVAYEHDAGALLGLAVGAVAACCCRGRRRLGRRAGVDLEEAVHGRRRRCRGTSRPALGGDADRRLDRARQRLLLCRSCSSRRRFLSAAPCFSCSSGGRGGPSSRLMMRTPAAASALGVSTCCTASRLCASGARAPVRGGASGADSGARDLGGVGASGEVLASALGCVQAGCKHEARPGLMLTCHRWGPAPRAMQAQGWGRARARARARLWVRARARAPARAAAR